ncbi:MAG: hypothetical protein A2259_02985 [Candidatus Moranbacteria bacterium RIFOXYA2_FULL_43_15]|nr:MAG: hypothetical protein A2259_02985 [Candidatus Moranbacteria bacterium RIFOXYA2_FULL_43_15]
MEITVIGKHIFVIFIFPIIRMFTIYHKSKRNPTDQKARLFEKAGLCNGCVSSRIFTPHQDYIRCAL